MSIPYCLVVIDMQEAFDAANDPQTIHNVKQLINKAKDDLADIIILEYYPKWHGHTHKEILELIDGYEFGRTLVKSEDDGSEAILDSGYTNTFFLLCGVNTAACVARTACGMSELFPQSQIDIDFGACNQPAEWEHQYPDEADLENLVYNLHRYNNIRCLV